MLNNPSLTASCHFHSNFAVEKMIENTLSHRILTTDKLLEWWLGWSGTRVAS